MAIVRRHLPGFLERVEENAGPLPKFVTDELHAFLTCGDFEYGFLKLACQCCGHQLRVPFSCKGRGFCPSCMGRRMAEGAALLVDTLLPPVRYRQFVLSFEGSLAIRLGYDKHLLTRVCQVFASRILASVRKRVKHHHDSPSVANLHPGLITVVQRFRGDAGLYVHLHSLATDGAYLKRGDTVRWLAAPELSQAQLQQLLDAVHRDLHDVLDESELDDFDVEPSLSACVQLSLAAPYPVAQPTQPPALPQLLAAKSGIRIHADTAVDGRDRRRLERLCRYLLRPPFSHDAIEALPNGNVRLHMKRPNKAAASYVDMHPNKFLAKLAALVPPPRFHMTRYHGVFANKHHLRPRIAPAAPNPLPIEPKQLQLFSVDTSKLPPLSFFPDKEQVATSAKRMSWARLLARVFDIDVTVCPRCKGRLKIIGAVTHPDAIADHLHGKGSRAPPRPRPHHPDQTTLFPA